MRMLRMRALSGWLVHVAMLPHLCILQCPGQRLLDVVRPCVTIAPLVLKITQRREGKALSVRDAPLRLPNAIHAPSVAEAVAKHEHRALHRRCALVVTRVRVAGVARAEEGERILRAGAAARVCKAQEEKVGGAQRAQTARQGSARQRALGGRAGGWDRPGDSVCLRRELSLDPTFIYRSHATQRVWGGSPGGYPWGSSTDHEQRSRPSRPT
jgi:hypothetical protein